MNQFIWVWRKYLFEGKRFQVVQTFKDNIVVREELGPFNRGPDRTIAKSEFAATAELIEEV